MRWLIVATVLYTSPAQADDYYLGYELFAGRSGFSIGWRHGNMLHTFGFHATAKQEIDAIRSLHSYTLYSDGNYVFFETDKYLKLELAGGIGMLVDFDVTMRDYELLQHGLQYPEDFDTVVRPYLSLFVGVSAYHIQVAIKAMVSWDTLRASAVFGVRF